MPNSCQISTPRREREGAESLRFLVLWCDPMKTSLSTVLLRLARNLTHTFKDFASVQCPNLLYE